MRTDENSDPCPHTLQEYRDMCASIGGEDCEAVAWLDSEISKSGADEKVVAPDSQMRGVLMPRLIPAGKAKG